MRVLLLGAGKIGEAIVAFLQTSTDYTLTVADQSTELLQRIPLPESQKKQADVSHAETLATLLADQDAVLSALPFYLSVPVAQAARNANVHYLDLTEDVATTHAIQQIAQGATTAFIPQCGLAPGFISIVAYSLAQQFESLERVQMRVGALPEFPVNALKYNLTWSTDGLINEYCNPCEVIREGRRIEVVPMEGLEHFSLDGIEYEAFNTSGGLGTLCDTWADKLHYLDYKTVRYPGHCKEMQLLLTDLRLSERRELLKDVLERAIPVTKQDVVLVFVTISGSKEGRLTQTSYAKKVYPTTISQQEFSAIQVTTAAGICTMLDLLHSQKLPQQGFIRQEDALLDDFLANRFGSVYG